jgi:hypothetical protein
MGRWPRLVCYLTEVRVLACCATDWSVRERIYRGTKRELVYDLYINHRIELTPKASKH